MTDILHITNADIVGPKITSRNRSVTIEAGKIHSIGNGNPLSGIVLDLHGNFLYPGLINSHDHLLSTFLPRVGGNKPYQNWLAWDNEYKFSAVFTERLQLDPEQLYLLGAYKNLISGVSTVMDHIPKFVNVNILKNLPIRLVENYRVSHSVCSYSLGWGDDPHEEYQSAMNSGSPYVTHVSEGYDPESITSILRLHQMKALGEFSVLCSGLVRSDSDIRLIRDSGANYVWCPSSNLFLFGKTAEIRKMLDEGVPISLGTDASSHGALHLLEEIKVAVETYQNSYGIQLDPKEIFKMVTLHPSKAFRLKDQGEIEEGKNADLLVLRQGSSDPYLNLLNSMPEDIQLLIVDGRPVFGDAILEPFFQDMGLVYEKFKLKGTEKIMVGSPLSLLNSIYKRLGYKKDLAFLPISGY